MKLPLSQAILLLVSGMLLPGDVLASPATVTLPGRLPSITEVPSTDGEAANRTEPFAPSSTPRPARTMPPPPPRALLALTDRWEDLIGELDTLSDRQCLQAFQQLQARPITRARDTVLRAILVSFAVHDRHVPLARLMAMMEPAFAHEIWNDLPDFTFSVQWTHYQPEETARWLVTQGARFLPLESRAAKIASSILVWSRDAPRAAAEFTSSLPLGLEGNPMPPNIFCDVADAWGRSDLPGALAWAEALPEGKRRTSALVGVVAAMTNDDPSRAKSYVERQIGRNQDAPDLAREVAYWLFYKGGETAGWAFSLPDAASGRAALRGLVNSWSDHAEDGDQLRAGATPPAAFWAVALPPGDGRSAALVAVAADWSALHPDNARRWLRGLPAGADRTEAIAAYDQAIVDTARDELAHGEAEKALDEVWEYPFERQFSAGHVRDLLGTWAKQDAPAANRWSVRHGLTENAPRTRNP